MCWWDFAAGRYQNLEKKSRGNQGRKTWTLKCVLVAAATQVVTPVAMHNQGGKMDFAR